MAKEESGIYFIIAGIILFSLYYIVARIFGHNSLFIWLLLLILFVMRQVGNRVASRLVFVGQGLAVFIGMIWGLVIAALIHLGINHYHPNLVFKIVGLAGGVYAAIINYQAIPENGRTEMGDLISVVTYVIASTLLVLLKF